jgi:arylsulfatase A-like enzyme
MRRLTVIGGLLLAAPLQAQRAPAPKVLIIGIDGVRPDVLAQVETPNLDALIAAGTYSDRARTGLPTVSGPGWSSMLIGVWPSKHGVLNNDFTTNRYAEYPDLFTRIEQVRPALNTFVVADWLPLVTSDAGGPLIVRVDVRVVLNGYDLGWARADSQSVAVAVDHLSHADVDAAFVYLGNPDETSHETESIGAEYRAALELSDRHVGQLVAALRSRPSYAREDWLILVSTDHGRRSDGGHGGDSEEERTIFYLASGPAAVAGRPIGTPEIIDVAVTSLAHLGVPIDAAWALDGKVVGLAR